MKLSATPSIFRPSIHSLCILSCAVNGRHTALAITVCSVFNSARERTSSWRVFKFVDEAVGLQGFAMDFVEGRDVIVPFEKGGGFPDEADGMGI